MAQDGKPLVHVVFGMSPAASLRQALALSGREGRVLGMPDDLSFGPIISTNASPRASWIENELGYTDYDEVVQMAEMFWREVTSVEYNLVAWVNRRCAPEYAGFLEFLWRMDETPCAVVDVTEVQFVWRDGSRKPSNTFGRVTPKQMVDAALFDRATALSPADREGGRRAWSRLRQENAPLRIVTSEGLQSAPITVFDDLVVSCVTQDWRKSARVVGEALGLRAEGPFDQGGDLVLCSRLRALADQGVVESRGDMSLMQDSFVRKGS